MKKAIDLFLLLFALLLTCSEPMNDKYLIPHTLLVVGAWLLVAIVSNLRDDKASANRKY